jgi:DNA modification methylase
MASPDPYYSDDALTLLQGKAEDVLTTLPDGSVNCCVTSPPYYGLRDYGVDGQLGLESTPDEYVAKMVGIFREVRRVLADDGTLWLNLGDSFNSIWKSSALPDPSLPEKNLLGLPWRVAFMLQAEGWVLRNAIVWWKPNATPDPVRDRLSTTYELVFLFSKKPRYWFDLDPIRQLHSESALYQRDLARKKPHRPGKAAAPGNYRLSNPSSWGSGKRELNDKGANPGDVWSVSTTPYNGAHFAPMPLQLARRCVAAGCKPGGTVLDPFCGTGTSLLAANQSGRRGVGIDLNPDYLKLALERCQQAPLALDDGGAS